MRWSDVGNFLAKNGASILGSILGGPASMAAEVGTLVSKAAGSDNTPDATMAALQNNPQAIENVKKLELEHEVQLTQLHLQAETTRQAAINKTIQAEIASNDRYVRCWRPTYGYMVSISWFVQMSAISFALTYTICKSPADLPAVIGALTAVFGALAGLWGIALSVLGINISSRSKDKQVAAGQVPSTGILGAIAQRIIKGKNG